jgi:hypothetical protein
LTNEAKTIAVLKAETDQGDLIADLLLIIDYQPPSGSVPHKQKITKSFRIDHFAKSINEDCIIFDDKFTVMIPNNQVLAVKEFVIYLVNYNDGSVKKLDFPVASLVGITLIKYAGKVDGLQHYAYGGNFNKHGMTRFADEDLMAGYISDGDASSISTRNFIAKLSPRWMSYPKYSVDYIFCSPSVSYPYCHFMGFEREHAASSFKHITTNPRILIDIIIELSPTTKPTRVIAWVLPDLPPFVRILALSQYG